jgi:hypothetical protein
MLSILGATVAVPLTAARSAAPAHGLRRALLYTFAFDALYFIYLTALRSAQ